jgi:aldehyde dehydrogenase (NAD+)
MGNLTKIDESRRMLAQFWQQTALTTDKEFPALSDGLRFYPGTSETTATIISPADGTVLGKIRRAGTADYSAMVGTARAAFERWRQIPAPKRGEIVRQIGDAFRRHKNELAALISLEMGKIYQEGLGEVQEIIDICDFAVGLSRQLYGLTMTSERPEHRLYEQWHPLGVVGIISAFNFPVAVWAWNAMIAAVCGNVSLWKPSEKTPLCAVACMNIVHEVLAANEMPAGVMTMAAGDAAVGMAMAADERVALVSATGSTRMGRSVAQTVAARFGKSLLELGGNNAVILTPSADLDLALRAITFAAVGTCGQRCTTTRRLFVPRSMQQEVERRLCAVYAQIAERIGHPLDPDTLVGPLIDAAAVEQMQNALASVAAEGGEIIFGGQKHALGGNYVVPAIVRARNDMPTVQRETFAPILYLIVYDTLEEAIAHNNAVPQGLSSAIFSNDLRETERFLSASGSDCGIANVNIGTSGAEIGGAFGGEKETGGGRESGSDAWKAYMRRQTVTINYGATLTLAQGIKFE